MSKSQKQDRWPIFRGNTEPHDGMQNLPDSPPWRQFEGKVTEGYPAREAAAVEQEAGIQKRGKTYEADEKVIELVNAALFLRRPLLVTGKPGSGKSSLAYAVAYELKLGRVLYWPITSRSTLQEALYRYDAIGRLHEANLSKGKKEPDIGKFVRLGPLGTALLPTELPQVLLIDEIDKSNIDLPNDLLNIFEVGEYEIPELARLSEQQAEVEVLPQFGSRPVTICNGRVQCKAFPFVVITSNGEREMPPPFLRRCIRLDIDEPSPEKLAKIVSKHFLNTDDASRSQMDALVQTFLERRTRGDLATDQLLNAIYLTLQGVKLDSGQDTRDSLLDAVLKYLSTQEAG